MFCPKCGTKLPDGSKFCSGCGERLTDIAAPVVETPVVEPPVVETPVAETPVVETPVVEIPVVETPVVEAPVVEPPVAETPVEEAPVVPPVNNVPKPEFVKPKKKIDTKKIVIIAIAAVAALAVLIGVIALVGSAGGDNAYVYLSDGRYELLTNIDKGESLEIASSKSDMVHPSLLAFSPDGKYVYYYTKYDSYAETGSLCRAEYGKLKENSKKNDKYIEVIATNVTLGFAFLDDGSLVYQNGDDTLYYFNGEEVVQVAKGINFYLTDDEGRLIYTTGDYEEGYTLYGVVLPDVDNKIKLASNYAYLSSYTDFDNILFVKYEDDESNTLYAVGFEKDVEKLAADVYAVYEHNGKVYYTADNGMTLSLYDFVEDTYADADAGIVEPDYDDFSVPEYSYSMVYGDDLSEDDFGELYTSCTRDLYWYGESTWWSYSMNEAVEHNWGDTTEGIHTATQNFIDKFADTADENGYILVTDEVKAALQEIQKYSDKPEEDWQWIWLCYEKYQSGTTTDYDAYYEAYDLWYEACDRIEMREALQDPENDYNVRTLYCYDNGTVTALNENVLMAYNFGGGVLFNTTDMLTETMRLEEINSTYDVRQLFQIDYEAENYVLLTESDTTCRLSARAAESIAESEYDEYTELYFTDKEVYLNDSNGALSVAPISGGVVDAFSFITDDARVLTLDGNTLYYMNGTYTNNDISYCDLYSYSKGESTRLARDVIVDDLKCYDDGVILAYTGYRTYSGYELTMIDAKGNSTIIADNVTQYIRVDKSNLLFISDGDLYQYDGKERSMVQMGVQYIWCMNEMEPQHEFGWYDYDYYYNDYGY